ncbi:MAG TPA: TadE/TadG family type IV pilus assembly protein [Candidatus Limnocylindria bacterium]|nr:TadE/TadG family type IV pilus assembly protein [Candidatus Limnocylindria bacterium]
MRNAVRSDRGQAALEIALLMPLLLLPLVFGLVEMGFLFSSHLTISASTREGARMGSNLANGGGTLGCLSGQSPNAATVDPQIIASVERSLTGAGTLIEIANITQIRIFKSTATGQEQAGLVNVWTYTPGTGPVVDGVNLQFSPLSVGWQACGRNNVSPADAIGITVKYSYQAKSPLRSFLPAFAVFNLSDSTVMVLNATN